MSAAIIPFPIGGARPLMEIRPVANVTFTRQWAEQHLPLIDAALDLLSADDTEFARRCRLIADSEGPSKLDQLAEQVDRLGSHVGEVVSALAMTAVRIRTTMARVGGANA